MTDDEIRIEVVPIDQLKQDPGNANLGTKRGMALLRQSLAERGAARSLLATSDLTLMAGNKTHTAAQDVGYKEAILVHTDGSRPVVVVRDDLDADNPQAQRLAIEDNRIGEVDLNWSNETLAAIHERDQQVLQGLFSGEEIQEIIQSAIEHIDTEKDEPEPELPISPELYERHDYLVFYFDNEFDWNVAVQIFEVAQVLCGPVGNKTVKQKGLGRVIPGSKLLKMLITDVDDA